MTGGVSLAGVGRTNRTSAPRERRRAVCMVVPPWELCRGLGLAVTIPTTVRAEQRNVRGYLQPLPPTPSPRRRGGDRHFLLPLSVSGRGSGGGVASDCFSGSGTDAKVLQFFRHARVIQQLVRARRGGRPQLVRHVQQQ